MIDDIRELLTVARRLYVTGEETCPVEALYSAVQRAGIGARACSRGSLMLTAVRALHTALALGPDELVSDWAEAAEQEDVLAIFDAALS